jgi:hypothetical protein
MKTMLRIVCSLLFLCVNLPDVYSQVDLDCQGRDMHSIYLVSGSGFYRIDSIDTNPGTPVFLTSNSIGAIGISINNDLSITSGPLTLYSCTNYYFYWDGSNWVNTGHTTGNGSCVNPGGSSNYIYNLADNGSALYRYDGTAVITGVLSNVGTSNDFVHDVAADNLGNFYLFFTNAQIIVAYSPAGIPLDTFFTTGFPTGSHCGLALLGDRVYAQSCTGSYELYEGIKSGNTINFTSIMNLGLLQCSDIATCPTAAQPLAISENSDLPGFAVYPSPAHDKIIIRLKNASLMEIYDSAGRLLISSSTKGITEYKMDVSDWNAGIYFIKALSENFSQVTGKFLVE